MKFREIETKYRVTDLKLAKYQQVAVSREPDKYIEASGYDYYFVNESDPDCICRYRAGNLHELTVKRKHVEKNNFVRTEVNLPVRPRSYEEIDTFCSTLGFKFNFSIFKACWIYDYADHNLVYYVVYDSEMKEIDRFMEIEMKEDFPWKDETEAWNRLVGIEESLDSLGISARSRLKKSLFEMLRNE